MKTGREQNGWWRSDENDVTRSYIYVDLSYHVGYLKEMETKTWQQMKEDGGNLDNYMGCLEIAKLCA